MHKFFQIHQEELILSIDSQQGAREMRGKKPKLKTVLKKVLVEKEKKREIQAPTKASTKDLPSSDHVIRHVWSNGHETDIPFLPCHLLDFRNTTLVIGDGNFSYSCALAKIIGKEDCGSHLIATCLDSEEALIKKYSESKSNIEALKEAGVKVLFNVDGTKMNLKTSPLCKEIQGKHISRIIFNYPHTGAGIKDRARNIKAQQKMLKSFFESAKCLIKTSEEGNCTRRAVSRPSHHNFSSYTKKRTYNSDDEEDYESPNEEADQILMQPEIHVSLRIGDPYDDWNIKQLASSVGLTCLESFRFEPLKYVGYTHARTIGDIIGKGTSMEEDKDHDFLKRPSKTFVFVSPKPKKLIK